MLGLLVFGLVVGIIARLLVPGRQNLGIIATLLLGIVGSVIGGVVANALGTGDILHESELTRKSVEVNDGQAPRQYLFRYRAI